MSHLPGESISWGLAGLRARMGLLTPLIPAANAHGAPAEPVPAFPVRWEAGGEMTKPRGRPPSPFLTPPPVSYPHP